MNGSAQRFVNSRLDCPSHDLLTIPIARPKVRALSVTPDRFPI